MTDEERKEKMKEERKKDPLTKIADMTVEMAKLVLTMNALSSIKNKETGRENGFAEIGDVKLSQILGIDKSRIGGKNGIIQEAVERGYLLSSNVITNIPALDENGNPKINSKGETIMKSHRILAKNMEGIRAGYTKYGVEPPEFFKEKNIEKTKVIDFSKKEKEGLSR